MGRNENVNAMAVANIGRREAREVDVHDHIVAHEPCTSTEIATAIDTPLTLVQKALGRLMKQSLVSKHGRFKGQVVWTLPEYPADKAQAYADRKWLASGGKLCSSVKRPLARVHSDCLAADADMQRFMRAPVRRFVPADKFRATIPAGSVRWVFDLARKGAA